MTSLNVQNMAPKTKHGFDLGKKIHPMKWKTHTKNMIIFNNQQHLFFKEISRDFQVQAKNSHFFMGGKGVVSGHPPGAWQLGGCPLPWYQASTNGSSDGIYESRRKAFIQRPLAAWRGFFFFESTVVDVIMIRCIFVCKTVVCIYIYIIYILPCTFILYIYICNFVCGYIVANNYVSFIGVAFWWRVSGWWLTWLVNTGEFFHERKKHLAPEFSEKAFRNTPCHTRIHLRVFFPGPVQSAIPKVVGWILEIGRASCRERV